MNTFPKTSCQKDPRNLKNVWNIISRKISATEEIAYDDECAKNGIYMSQEILSCLFKTKRLAGTRTIYLPYLLHYYGLSSHKALDSVDLRLQRTHKSCQNQTFLSQSAGHQQILYEIVLYCGVQIMSTVLLLMCVLDISLLRY